MGSACPDLDGGQRLEKRAGSGWLPARKVVFAGGTSDGGTRERRGDPDPAKLVMPVDTHVQRWGGGLPQYAVGHLDRVARIRAAVARVPGLVVCGAAYDGVGIPAVIASARWAAVMLTQEIGPGRMSP